MWKVVKKGERKVGRERKTFKNGTQNKTKTLSDISRSLPLVAAIPFQCENLTNASDALYLVAESDPDTHTVKKLLPK